MSAGQSLLIELGTEELPPKALDDLAAAFAGGIARGLGENGIPAALDRAVTYATPRRLAVLVPEVAQAQGTQTIERRGPAFAAAYDADGQPTKALLGFAKSCGVEVGALQKEETGQGAWLVFRSARPGQPLSDLLLGIVRDALAAMPIPRPMRWADHDYSFVRPVHWLVMLHGDTVIEGEMLGLRSGRQSRGHRFMHPGPIDVASADAWLDTLRKAKVLADPSERRTRIFDQVARAARGLGTPRLDSALLDEIANLTEWPVAIACTFERDFLAVPAEALVSTMETHQKFVPVFDAHGALTEHFIGVANIESRQPEEIRKGYERVIRPRFADARFFWDEDLKTALEDSQQGLQRVTYQQSLGSLWDKSVRVAELARVIANRLRDTGIDVDAGAATRAASLAKCDLLSRMVGEFPELQGVMGRYYARHHGEPEAIAEALDSHYRPRVAGDAIAADPLGQVLAVAERLDTLAGIFAVGMKPSGNKDPFALRRAALGLARTLIEGELPLDLRVALVEALEQLPDAAFAAGTKVSKGAAGASDPAVRRAALAQELYDFVFERMRGYYAEQGFGIEQFDAVLALAPGSPFDFDRRLRAVAAFARQPEAVSLAAANKRVANLLRKADAAPAKTVDPSLFREPAEHALAHALAVADEDTRAPLASGDYTAVLTRLARLQTPVDAFFDAVLVNADDPAVRANRLALLRRLAAQFGAIAEIDRLSR